MESKKDVQMEMLEQILEELEQIKRYAAGAYSKVDTEIDELLSITKRIQGKIIEMDRQIDKIEHFERSINETKQSVRNMERKIK